LVNIWTSGALARKRANSSAAMDSGKISGMADLPKDMNGGNGASIVEAISLPISHKCWLTLPGRPDSLQ
jgi:hypothetical protein